MMKKIVKILIIHFFTIVSCYAQGTLQVNIKDCRNKDGYAHLAAFKLFKNDMLTETFQPKSDNKVTIKNLGKATYRIEYKTLFGSTESVSITIKDKGKYSIDLCLDYIDYEKATHTPFIQRLQNGESYTIRHASQGCFHSVEHKITISKQEGQYHLEFDGAKMPLDNNAITAIRNFEVEAMYMQPTYSCTTTETYTFSYKGQEITNTDGTCAWNGFHRLMQTLELIKE